MKMDEMKKTINQHKALLDEKTTIVDTIENEKLTQAELKKATTRLENINDNLNYLVALEKTWNLERNSSYHELPVYYTRTEVAKRLHVSETTIAILSNNELLHPVKVGKNFMYIADDIVDFMNTYAGKDVSNEDKAIHAKKCIESRNN